MRRVPLGLSLTLAAALAAAGLSAPAPAARASEAVAADNSAASEQWRPVYHYAPAKNWINDPNGLVYENGTYHLFYQHNPEGTAWGNMSWGHAASTDLVHWTEQDVAIPATDDYGVFSGSAVYDENNTSGLGTKKNPPIVAIWTRADNHTGIQAQSLSYSTDHGKTWTNLNDGAPILDVNNKDFRDPKVFWDSTTNRWTMAVALSVEHKISLYSSTDLIHWTHQSDFGPMGDTTAVWECPDLFEIPVEGGGSTWVLSLSIAGRTKYFTGSWDGTTYSADPVPVYDGSEGTLLEGFDSGSWDGWTVNADGTQGTAIGTAPATGDLAGHQGTGYVDTYGTGDNDTGSLTSPTFTIGTDYINVLTAGGTHPYDASATGDNGGGTLLTGFDDGSWDGWTVSGSAFGDAPSTGTNPGQQALHNQQGAGLLNSFYDTATGQGSDAGTGTATSPAFTITADRLNLLVGGGHHPEGDTSGKEVVELVVDGEVVRSVTGSNTEALNWQSVDVSDLRGKSATLRVVDESTSGWGHIMLDEARLSDTAASPFPTNTSVNVVVDGEVVASATGNSSGTLDWQSMDVARWKGKEATIVIQDNSSSDSWGHLMVDSVTASDTKGFSQAESLPVVDHGRDDYAAVTWNSTPDGKRYAIGWMSSWDYANDLPTSTWREAMTVPREYTARTVNGQVRIYSGPVSALDSLRTGTTFSRKNTNIRSAERSMGKKAAGRSYDMELTIDPGTAERSGVKVLVGEDQETVVGYDATTGEVYLDRTKSSTSPNDSFPSVDSAKVSPEADGLIHLRVLVDHSSVEVFANDGAAVITDAVYPDASSTGVSLFAENGRAHFPQLTIHELGSYTN